MQLDACSTVDGDCTVNGKKLVTAGFDVEYKESEGSWSVY